MTGILLRMLVLSIEEQSDGRDPSLFVPALIFFLLQAFADINQTKVVVDLDRHLSEIYWSIASEIVGKSFCWHPPRSNQILPKSKNNANPMADQEKIKAKSGLKLNHLLMLTICDVFHDGNI